MKKQVIGGRPKVAEQLVVIYLKDGETGKPGLTPLDVQIKEAHATKASEYRVCVHGMKVSRRACVKRLACSLCEKRVAEHKPLLWKSQ